MFFSDDIYAEFLGADPLDTEEGRAEFARGLMDLWLPQMIEVIRAWQKLGVDIQLGFGFESETMYQHMLGIVAELNEQLDGDSPEYSP